jgi:hypothetical protein
MIIPRELRERAFVELVNHINQFLVIRHPWRKGSAVSFAQRRYKNLAMFFGKFAILLAAAIVETDL